MVWFCCFITRIVVYLQFQQKVDMLLAYNINDIEHINTKIKT
jgi:hypothetical protein